MCPKPIDVLVLYIMPHGLHGSSMLEFLKSTAAAQARKARVQWANRIVTLNTLA